MTIKYKCLYEITGRIEDVNTFLVPLQDLPKQEQGEPVAVIEVKGGKAWLHAELFTHLGDGLHKFYTTPQPKQEQGEPVAYILRNEYNEYRLEPTDSFKIQDLPVGTEVLLYPAPQQRKRILFPTMLRKMWSGSEVQAWIDEHVNKDAA